jgi:hypothetical protein
MTTTTTHTFRIPDRNLEPLQARIAVFAKKALKLGIMAPVLTVGEREDVIVPRVGYVGMDVDVVNEVRVFWHVTLTSAVIKVDGWTFVATIDHTAEAGVIINRVPGFEGGLPTSFRDAKPVCDHCGFNRRRASTFVLVNEAGAWKQVGRNCLQDFFAKDAQNEAKAAELGGFALALCGGSEDEDFFGCGGGRSDWFQLSEVMQWTARVVRLEGWLSRGKARELGREGSATADGVLVLMSNSKAGEEARKNLGKVEQTDIDTATQAIAWARELRNQTAELSEYEQNVAVVCGGEAVREKWVGIAASAVVASNRAIIRARELANAAKSVHFGTVGKREVFTLTVTGINTFEGNFGVRVLYRLRDGAGNVATWWTNDAGIFADGATITVKATVKDHADYKGTKQTVLSRVAEFVAPVKKARKPRAKKAVVVDIVPVVAAEVVLS